MWEVDADQLKATVLPRFDTAQVCMSVSVSACMRGEGESCRTSARSVASNTRQFQI